MGSAIYSFNANLDVNDSVLSNPDSEFEIELPHEGLPGSNVTLLNTTFDKSKVSIEADHAYLFGGSAAETTFSIWKTVSNGSFRITIDGITRDVEGMNFTAAPDSMDAFAAIIQTAINNADTSDGFVNASCGWDGGRFVISSGTFGFSSSIANLGTHSGGLGTDISGMAGSSHIAFMNCGVAGLTDIPTWANITNGTFGIWIDGAFQNVGPVNFSYVASMDDVATNITTALVLAGFTGAQCTWFGDHFRIISGTEGLFTNVSALEAGVGGTDISGPAFMNGLAGIETVIFTEFGMDCAVGTTIIQGDSSRLHVKWYMHLKVVQQGTGFGLPNADVEVRDVNGVVVAVGTTDDDGYMRNIVVDEYFQYYGGLTPYTDHFISATFDTVTGSTSATIDGTKEVILELNYVSDPPVANAGGNQSMDAGANFTLDGSASTDDLGIANWTWTIGNITLYGEKVNYSLTTYGDYNVTLTVTDVEGFTDTDELVLTILDNVCPVADAGPDQAVNEDALVTFDGSGSTDLAGIDNYTWTFNDGTARTLYGATPAYTFANPGVYLVTLTVTDPSGNSASDNMNVTVADITPPVVNGGPGITIAQGTIVTLNGSASSDNMGVTAYTWTFNDGLNDVIRYGPSFDYRFQALGNYTITLTCTDAAGNSAFTTTWVNVVDITPPKVLVVAPGESLTQVPLNWALIIVFDEPMDRASAEAAFSITGTTVIGFDWDLDSRYVKINLATLNYNTTYSFSITTNATDVSGNGLINPFTSSFTTRNAPSSDSEPTDIEADFMADNWWILLVIIVVLAILLLVSLLRGKKEPAAPAPVAGETPPAPPEEPPAEPAPEETPAPEEPPAEEEIQ
ncbi:MAG: PKD domain-containing protein [Thermoplasmata archaeon]